MLVGEHVPQRSGSTHRIAADGATHLPLTVRKREST